MDIVSCKIVYIYIYFSILTRITLSTMYVDNEVLYAILNETDDGKIVTSCGGTQNIKWVCNLKHLCKVCKEKKLL